MILNNTHQIFYIIINNIDNRIKVLKNLDYNIIIIN